MKKLTMVVLIALGVVFSQALIAQDKPAQQPTGDQMNKSQTMEKKGTKMQKKGAKMQKKGAKMQKKGESMDKKSDNMQPKTDNMQKNN
ncbi:MAG TPA: hypothetical protein VMM57_04790 [Bacteroidota bacterium]|nr:hypothetical protein [Bacteroidota bacterium]